MDRLITQEERERKTKRNQLYLGIILIGLMVFSTLGFAFSNNIIRNSQNSQDKIEYNGIEFIQDSGYWKFTHNNYEFLTSFNPEEVKDIFFNSTVRLDSFANKPLYFIGEKGDHFLEIERNLGGRFVERISYACINEKDCNENLPVKDCSKDNIIVYKEAKDEIEKIYQGENCVFIVSSLGNQSKFADVFLFNVLGIK